MLEAIKRLRSQIDISIPEAKRFLQQYGEDGDSAFEAVVAERIQPIIVETDSSPEDAKKAYFGCNQDVTKAIARLRYQADPEKFGEASRPKFSDYLVAMKAFKSPLEIYELFDLCDAIHVVSPEEAEGLPPSLATLSYILTFYSYYQTDTSALLEIEGSIHSSIQEALTTIGFSDVASRYAGDVAAGEQLDENFDYFNRKCVEFYSGVREFSVANARELFDYRQKSTGKA